MTGDVHIQTIQDVDANLGWSKRLQNDDEYSKQGMKQEMWHYGHVPLLVQVKWLNEYGLKNWPMKPENKELLFRLLNSPEYEYLKTTKKIHIARS